MKKAILLCCFVILGLLLGCRDTFAQSIRSDVNKGVRLYKDGKFIDSEVEFKKGLEKSPKSFHANFNLGDSYYKQGKYQDALDSYMAALPDAKTNFLKSQVYHNIGNALLKDKKIKESIEAYSKSLGLNPNDQATKYNLSYALDLLKNQNKKNKDNKKNDKNNQDKNNQNKNKNDQKNNQNNNQNQNKNNQQNKQQNQQNQPQQDKISKQQAQAIFAALNNDEKSLQKQLRKKAGKPVKTTKDW